MERDKKNTVLLRKKNEEMEVLQMQIENKKTVNKTERKRIMTEESCSKCK